LCNFDRQPRLATATHTGNTVCNTRTCQTDLSFNNKKKH
jgi:hypothetical protein